MVRIRHIFWQGFLILAACVVAFPMIWVLFRSFGLFSGGQTVFSLAGYSDYFLWKPLYLNAFMRSFAVAGIAAVGAILVALPAAYVFAKVPFPGRGLLFYGYILVMIMPFQVTLLPQYMTARFLNLFDSLPALIFPGIFSPFPVFLLTQTLKTLPNETIETALLDTNSMPRILWKIIAPAMTPGIFCSGTLVFTEQWNQVAEPLVLLESPQKFPLAVLLDAVSLQTLQGLAACALFLLVPFLLYGYFEKEILTGLGEYKLK